MAEEKTTVFALFKRAFSLAVPSRQDLIFDV
jgi:hypothetical protein